MLGAGLGAASSAFHKGDILEGAASGALGGALSESVMKLMENDIQTAIDEAHDNCHTKEERLEFLNEFMRKKTDMSVLLSTCVATLLDLDPSMTEFTARNALENNCLLQVAGAALTIWEMYDTYQETGDFGEVLKTGAVGIGATIIGAKGLQAGAKLVKGFSSLTAKKGLSKLAYKQGKVHLKKHEKKVHGNSLNYKGDTHVYKIVKNGKIQKYGESTRGTNKFGQSKRAIQQARKLYRQTGERYETEIVKRFDNKRAAKDLETKLIKETKKADPTALPLNKNNH